MITFLLVQQKKNVKKEAKIYLFSSVKNDKKEKQTANSVLWGT
jgi:hypothetical protein